ncbi:c-type cytochrome [Halovulum sp. GXIMD14793]
MLKGATLFDAAKANAALATMKSASADFGTYFPEGSETAESEAGPKIWTDRAGFDKAVAKFQADLDAAVAAASQDQDGVKAAFGQVASNYKSCHEDYRVKKD